MSVHELVPVISARIDVVLDVAAKASVMKQVVDELVRSMMPPKKEIAQDSAMSRLAVELTNLWSHGSKYDFKAEQVVSKRGQRPGNRIHVNQATVQEVDLAEMGERTEVAGRNHLRCDQVCPMEFQLDDGPGLAQRHNFHDHLGGLSYCFIQDIRCNNTPISIRQDWTMYYQLP